MTEPVPEAMIGLGERYLGRRDDQPGQQPFDDEPDEVYVPVCDACGDRPIGCSRCADEDGTR